MSKRRTDAEIREVQKIHERTSDVAREIDLRVNGDTEDPAIGINAAAYWHNKAEYQRGIADTLVITFSSKDPAVIERVALAMKAALEAK